MMRRYLLTTTGMVALALAPMLSGPAYADTILAFGQSGSGTITATISGSTTTISASNDQVFVTSYAGATPVPFTAFLTFSVTSSSSATLANSQVTENYSGSFRICSTHANCAAAGHANIDYLSGTFTSTANGQNGGTQLTFGGSEPGGDAISYVSDEIPVANLGDPKGIGLTLVDIPSPPGVHITSNTIASFTTNSISGNFSSNFAAPPPTNTPEPASLAVLGVALAGLGMSRRRRR